MGDSNLAEFQALLQDIVGFKNVFLEPTKTLSYRTGIRVGKGDACAVVFPKTLLEIWKLLELCVSFDKIIIVQAANTGLTGGSTPDGNNYDRDIVIINTLKVNQLILLEKGLQVIAFPGTTLYQLEKKLLPLGRGPHSLIGSSCIGASVIGGVCNNSGGNLVNRGPAYTELSLFARLNDNGKLELINHLDIDLGSSPEEIIINLQNNNFNNNHIKISSLCASDRDYQQRVRDVNSFTPARFNADQRRLYESSGCAGKIAVFAVRLDTFPKPEKEKVFFVGSNQPSDFTYLRKKILTEFTKLPEMGEYMHRNYFTASEKYCKDNFLLIKFFGPEFLPRLFAFKRSFDQIASNLPFLPENISDKILQFFSKLLPNHLPNRLRDFQKRFSHYMIFLASDSCIEQMNSLLENQTSDGKEFAFFECDESEGKDVLLHRYVAGAAPGRFKILNKEESGDILPLDVALPRNCNSWDEILPKEILDEMSQVCQMGHFLCMVFHWDFVVSKGKDSNALKQKILSILDDHGAKYPAEHNVGHLYHAEECLSDFYKNLDPTNSFNSGIGMMSKKKYYR